MQIQDCYPIIVTEHRADCREFYRRWFALQVVFEASWFVLLGSIDKERAVVAFMHPCLFDPAGVWIDVVEQIEPVPGWWDRYLPA
jgi:hypothetical protein